MVVLIPQGPIGVVDGYHGPVDVNNTNPIANGDYFEFSDNAL